MIQTYQLPDLPFKGKLIELEQNFLKLQKISTFLAELKPPVTAELHYPIVKENMLVREFGGIIDPLEKLNNLPEWLNIQYPGYVIVVRNLLALESVRKIIWPVRNQFFIKQPIPFAHLAATISQQGGTIGYHLDNYHVVILQLSGTRIWNIWDPASITSEEKRYFIRENRFEIPEYKLRKKEDAKFQFELNQNEFLFIPALFPHEGITGECCDMSLSLSFVWQALSGYKLFQPLFNLSFPEIPFQKIIGDDKDQLFYSILKDLPTYNEQIDEWLEDKITLLAYHLKNEVQFSDNDISWLINYWLRQVNIS